MLNRIKVLFCLSYTINIAHAQELTGNIVDSISNQPIGNVTIYSLPEKLLTSSDVNGNFTFKSDRKTSGLLITAIGYSSKSVSLTDFKK
ncbi:MAG: carboxypeptidase-like regulatory domain-containing protein [Puia sp.]